MAVNRAALELYEAATAEDLLEGLPRTFTERSYEAFKQELVAMWRGSMQHELEAEVRTLSGAPRQVVIRWSVSPDHQETLSRVFAAANRDPAELVRTGESREDPYFGSTWDAWSCRRYETARATCLSLPCISSSVTYAKRMAGPRGKVGRQITAIRQAFRPDC